MVLMKIAAHLVHPLPVFIPAYGHFIHGKEILSLGFKVHDHPVCGVPHDDD
jgi:glycerol-3-phosphate dehydrogenase